MNIGGLKPFLCKAMEPVQVRSSWERWKRAFEIYLEAEGVTDEKKMKNRLLHIGGMDLQDVYFGIPGVASDETDEEPYKSAIKKLDECFTPTRHSTFERHLFWTLKPTANEDFGDFVTKTRQQANKCAFGQSDKESRDIAVKDKVVACAPAGLQKKLLEKEMSVDDMITVVRVYQSVEKAAEEMNVKRANTNTAEINNMTGR